VSCKSLRYTEMIFQLASKKSRRTTSNNEHFLRHITSRRLRGREKERDAKISSLNLKAERSWHLKLGSV
jgi:hypothetical protein